MRGISPVIATVLLLLMAVAAVGGAWVWYQRMQTSAMAGGTGTVEQLKKTAVTVSVDRLTCTANGNFSLTLANTGTESVTLTNVTLASSAGGSVIAYKDSWTVSANSLDQQTLTRIGANCDSTTIYYISARVGAQYVIRDYPVTPS